MKFSQIQSFNRGSLILLCLLLPYTQTEDTENTTPVSYEHAHNLAVTAFEVLSPLIAHGRNSSPIQVANGLVDMALDRVRTIITQQKMDRLTIPDFTETFKTAFQPINIGSSFKGIDGWFESLLSITRKGNAVVYVDGTSLALDVPLGLDILQLGMKYEIKILGIKIKGGYIEGNVRSNNVMLSAAMEYATGKCKLKVRNLRITELGKIDVTVSGYGGLDWIATKIGSWVTERAHGRIQKAVDKILNDIILREMDRYGCPAL